MRRYKVYLEVGGKQVRVGEIEGNYSDDARFSYSKEYITKEEMDDYLSNATGKYVGIGVYIANDTKVNKILVLALIKQ